VFDGSSLARGNRAGRDAGAPGAAPGTHGAEFVGFEDADHFVGGEEAAKDVAGLAVEESALQDVAVEEAQGGAEREVTRKGAQPAAALEMCAEGLSVGSGISVELDAGFPV